MYPMLSKLDIDSKTLETSFESVDKEKYILS
jgi:hypothetical protein